MMNNPVSEIMTSKVYTVNYNDTLDVVKALFDAHNIHHIPVVKVRRLVGIISKTDFNKVLHGSRLNPGASELDDVLLKNYRAESLMSEHLAKIGPNDKIGTATEIFLDNFIHALLVVDENDDLLGIVTTYDVLRHCFHLAYPKQDLPELK